IHPTVTRAHRATISKLPDDWIKFGFNPSPLKISVLPLTAARLVRGRPDRGADRGGDLADAVVLKQVRSRT
ncbi:MAG: hypothetical protein L0Y57_08895, partial [Beijerinckiaceae bacterium]|nr:hypothetical protein [Beijerinckiaceae bacterium]